ncbi:MAG TPA: carbohydrate ABC transporter substrate-binding protein [Actinomycetes bacterium]|nr:carbohydrate ABC transporter substrate-binding protein [Actinomycetes bacterium]
MKRTARLLPALFALALAAAACGGDDDDGGAASQTSAANLQGQTVEVAAVWTGAERDNFTKVLDAFSQQTGATVTYTPTGDNVSTFIGSRIEGGSPPDVAVLPQQGVLVQLVEDGSLKPAPDDVKQAVADNFSQVWADLASVDGQLYGVYFKAANKSTMWYDVAALENAGVQPAATWDDYMTGAQTISDSGVTPVSIGGADGWTLTDWFENVYLSQAGAEKYDQLSKHEIPWTDESVVTALQTLAELWGNNDLIAGGAKGALQTDFPTSVTNVFAENPKAAMVYEGDFVAGVISSETQAQVGTDANFFPFPQAGDSAAVVGGGDVAVALTDKPASFELLKFLASKQAGEIWAAAGGFTSPNKNVDSSVYPDDVSRAIGEALVAAGDNFRFDMSDLAPAAFGGTVGKGEWKILQDFLADTSDPQGTAAALEEEAAKAFGS